MTTIVTEHKSKVKSKSVIEVLQYCKDQHLPARLVGRWVWIKFAVKPNADVRQGLKAQGFRWSHRRQQWANNCGHPTKPAMNYKPWERYATVGLDESLARMAVAI